MKKKLIELIKDIDIFGVDLGFKIKEKDEYGTLVGGLVFIFYICLTCYFLISYFVTFVNRSTYNQNTINNSLDNAPQLNLFNGKIAFAYGISVNDALNDSFTNYLQIKVNYVMINKTNNSKIKKPLNLTKCIKDNFHNLINNDFDVNQLDKYYCLNNTANDPLMSIGGIFLAEEFSYIEYSIVGLSSAMKNASSFKEYFDKNTIKFSLAYLDTSIDYSNFSVPEMIFLNSKYIQLSFPFIFKRNLDFGNNTFVNDANILFESDKESYFYSPSNYEEINSFAGTTRLIDKNADYDLFAKFFLRSSTKSMTMTRTYQKFPEFLADATSIVSELLIILMLLFGAYDKFRAEECVIDGVMQYKHKLIKKCPNEFNMLRDLIVDNNTPRGNEQEKKTTTESFKPNDDDQISKKTMNTNNSSSKRPNYHFKKISKGSYTNKIRSPNPKRRNAINGVNPITIPPEEVKATLLNYEGNTLKHSLLDMIKELLRIIICQKTKPIKEMMYDKGMNYFLNSLDIFTYFMKMREIDLIKTFMFDTHEGNLINFLSKPSISSVITNSNAPLQIARNELKLSQDTTERIIHSYNEMSNKFKNPKDVNDRMEKILKYTTYEINQLIM